MNEETRSQRQLILAQLFLKQKVSKSDLNKVESKAHLDNQIGELIQTILLTHKENDEAKILSECIIQYQPHRRFYQQHASNNVSVEQNNNQVN